MNPGAQLTKLMSTQLPTKTQQRRKVYRPDLRRVNQIYRLLNQVIFDNQLVRPQIILAQERKSLGWCKGYYYKVSPGTYCTIKLANKFYSIQWLIMVLAHEMAHQYQWDIIGTSRIKQGRQRKMSHGPSFFIHRKQLAEYGIPLLKVIKIDRWFQYQDLKKL